MITPNEAENLIGKDSIPFNTIELPIDQVVGHVLAEPIQADRPGPPFNRVAMDGIAIQFQALNNGQKTFENEGMQAAGSQQFTLRNSMNCIEVMTGAVLPEGCDTVIPFEKVNAIGSSYHLNNPESIKPSQNVHSKESDFSIGYTLVKPNTLINETHIAIAASVGKTNIKVRCLPKVAIITTGNELVEIDQTPKPYQIRKSNVYAIAAALRQNNFNQIDLFHLPDHLDKTIDQLKDILRSHDIVILSGGVSKGKLDYVPDALMQLGVQKVFHRIAQKPGKPMWYGTKDQKRIYALPGNPISVLICLHRYVLPFLRSSLSRIKYHTNKIKICEPVKAHPSLTLFQPVQFIHKTGKYHILKFNGSGDYASLAQSAGFVEVPSQSLLSVLPDHFSFYPWTT